MGVLRQMAYRLGIYEDTARQGLIESGPGGMLVEESGVFPQHRMLNETEWELIKAYYLSRSPDSLTLPRKELQIGIPGLQVEIPEFHIDPPMITAIEYDPENERIYVADAKVDYSTINILDRNFKSISTLALPSPISAIELRSDTILAILMGGMMPTDDPSGSIVRIFKMPNESEYKGYRTVLRDLQRPVAAAYADMNGDNLEDIVVCEFGNHTGKLSLFVRQGSGKYERRILSPDPGAVAVVVKDLDGDGLADIAALMAQGNERIDVYYNQGGGEFSGETLMRFPPSYGSVGMSVIDWNEDGLEDILYVNGDNADYSGTLKPYHGVRIFLNEGANQFSEAFFQHINGAYKAMAQDFDQDGDLDIATISFFPDLINTPEEGFVFLENTGGGDRIRFELRTFSQAASGRWIAMEAADLDQDDNSELILGAFTGMAVQGDIDGLLGKRLIADSPTLMMLKLNQIERLGTDRPLTGRSDRR